MAAALVSGFVPCCNNAATIEAAVRSLLAQTVPLAEVLVVDDGSTDGSADRLQALAGVRVIRHERNLGRGAARARGLEAASCDLVLCVDATNRLAPDFLARARPWLEEPGVAAIYGSITQRPAQTAVGRWRGRHLFRLGRVQQVRRHSPLITYGCLLHRPRLLQAGGFDARLRHSEDADLGSRLERAGFEVVYDPSCVVESLVDNTLRQVLERYWRWSAGAEEARPWRSFFRHLRASLRILAPNDLAERDPLAAGISLLLPWYCLWRGLHRRRRRS